MSESLPHYPLNIVQALGEATARLRPRLGENARFEAELLLGETLDKPRSFLHCWPEKRIAVHRLHRYRNLVTRRVAGEPIAYIIGRREFWSLELGVTPATLIPRHESELLVELSLALLTGRAECAVAELGTGSGAVSAAIATERPGWTILATDLSLDALRVAEANFDGLGLSNVATAMGDWCNALGARRFDLLVSNPPYISEADPHLRQGDLPFEPWAALASGKDGLVAIRTIAEQAPRHLHAGGMLLLEHGWNQGEQVRQILHQHGFVGIQTHRDLGGNERATLGKVNPEAK